mgnify:CR=1 FL=1
MENTRRITCFFNLVQSQITELKFVRAKPQIFEP